MAQPNYFSRNASFLKAGNYADSTVSINNTLPNAQWFISKVERFVDADENNNAKITISNGNIVQFTFNALASWYDINDTPTQTTNLDEILDFFTAP